MIWISWLSTLVAKIPNIKWFAGIGVALFLGLAIGNYHATQRAVRLVAEMTQERADREQSAVSQALIQWQKDQAKRISDKAAENAANDAYAHARYGDALNAAAKDAALARSALLSEKGKRNEIERLNSDLRNVNSMLATMAQPEPVPDNRPLLCGSAISRRLLDEASGARDSGDRAAGGVAEADPAGGADAAAEEGPVLTCEQLIEGYVNLGEVKRENDAQLEALQGWIDRALR